MERRLFTSESVTEGHPDKMCDQVSDAILDALMEKDPMSRVACETAMTTGLVLVMGEVNNECLRRHSENRPVIRSKRLDIQGVNMVLTQIHAVLWLL